MLNPRQATDTPQCPSCGNKHVRPLPGRPTTFRCSWCGEVVRKKRNEPAHSEQSRGARQEVAEAH